MLGSVYDSTSTEIESKYGKKVQNLRDYFELSDVIICEEGYMGSSKIKDFQKIQTYILAHNFENRMPDFQSIYLSRMLVPLLRLLQNARILHLERRPVILKYIVHGVHDLNLA